MGLKYDLTVLADSPVAFWKLNPESVGDGTVILDTVGNRPATVRGDWRSGPGPTSQIAGGIETSWAYDAWVDAGTDRIIGNGPGITLESWSRTRRPLWSTSTLGQPANPMAGYIMGAIGDPLGPWNLLILSDERLQAAMNEGPLTGPSYMVGVDRWHHYVLTAGAEGFRMYVDGELYTEWPDVPYEGLEDDFGIVKTLANGGLNNPAACWGVSRVAFFNYSLTPERVRAHWNARFGTDDEVGPPAATAQDNKILQLGASHYWKLAEDDTLAGAYAYDAIGVQHGIYRGTVEPTAGPNDAEVKAIALDGTVGDRVEIAGATWVGGPDNWALSWWAKTERPGEWETMIGAGSSGDNRMVWVLQQPNGAITWFLNNARYDGAVTVTRGAWHWYVLNVVNLESSLYVDGQLYAGPFGAFGKPSNDSGTQKNIGWRPVNTLENMAGAFGRLARFERALTEVEIAELWAARGQVAIPVTPRDGALVMGDAWYNELSGRVDTVADLLYENLWYLKYGRELWANG